jgi:hypothetical protein
MQFADNLKDTGIGSTLDSLISGVKNILPAKKDQPITRIVEGLMDGGGGVGSGLSLGSASLDDDYAYFDPKVTRGTAHDRMKLIKAGGGRVTFQEAIVFVVGGGNFVEYQNLQEFGQVKGL